MSEQTQAALTTIFHDVFDDDSIVLRPDLSAADVEDWDSLAHVRLLLTTERKMGIKFDAVEAGNLKNVGEPSSSLTPSFRLLPGSTPRNAE